ncbi:MAG: SBBP repeat-containing protein [Terriglobales bacterium]
MRLNRRRSGKTCSRSRILVAIMLLMLLAAVALTIGSGAGKLQADNAANPHQIFRSTATVPQRAPFVKGVPKVLTDYGRLPLMFEPNQGQTDTRVKFVAHGGGYGLYLTAKEAVLALYSVAGSRHPTVRASAVSMNLVGASLPAEPAGEIQLPGKSNYLIGNDPKKWHRDISQFARVRYSNVYPGIDVVYYGNQGRLEYDFEISPGSDPAKVALRFQGTESPKIDSHGDLHLTAGGSDLRFEAPRVYQKVGTEERPVSGRFELRGQAKDEVGFQLGAYDRSRTLIIDPVLVYSTYLGGSGNQACSIIAPITVEGMSVPVPPPGCPAITVDAASNAYVAGSTTSTNFPGTTGEYQPDLAPGATANVFIAKFSPTGALLFATYLGGNGTDYTAGVAVDSGFDILVAGTTSSGNFPTTDGATNAAFQTVPVSSGKHVFVSKLDPTGKFLLYSTYLSGNGIDIASGLAVDQSGSNAYVTGTTTSTEVGTGFPSTLGSYQTTPKATNQFFFTKVDPNTSGSGSVLYSTYFGGSSPSTGSVLGGGIAVDSNSNAYITGGTNFTDMPLLDAYQGLNEGGFDVFVAKINPSGVVGGQLLYSTYLGGSGDDVGFGVAVDSSPDTYVTGWTTSTDFNAGNTGTTALQVANGGGTDAFLAKIGVPCTGTSCVTFDVPLIYFTYLGGAGADAATSVTADNSGGARLIGWTNSPNFPIVGSPVQSTYGGGTSDAFFATVDTDATCSPIVTPTCTATSTTSYFGGTAADFGTGVALDLQGASYLAGETASASGFPLKNPYEGALTGPTDAFAAKFSPVLNLTMLPPTATPLVVGIGSQVSFAYTITNNGEFTNGVTFVDYLPPSGATFVSATASPGTCGSPANQTVLCNIGTLNAAATATVTVILTPVAPTLPSGTVSLGNSGSAFVGQSLLATASASVTVNDFSLSVAPSTSTVVAGVPAVFTATVTPSANSGFPDSVSISCGAGLPTGTTCVPGNNNPIPNLNTGAQSSQFIINTTTRVTTTTDLRHGSGPGIPFYATMLPVSGLALIGLGLGRKSSRKRRFLMGLLMGAAFTLLLFLPACHTAAVVSTTTGTPAGTYTVTVDAVSGSATRSQVVTLVVQ